MYSGKICTTVLMAIGIVASFSVNAACSQGVVAVTKPGYYAALNSAAYTKMYDAVENGDKDALDKLVRSHSVIEVPDGIAVCIKDPRAGFHWYRKHILIPGYPGEYWISDEALNEVK